MLPHCSRPQLGHREGVVPSLLGPARVCGLWRYLPLVAEGAEQGTVPGRALAGLGTPSPRLSPTPRLLKASIELAPLWAAAPAGQGLRASLGDKTTKSWKESPLSPSPARLRSSAAEVSKRRDGAVRPSRGALQGLGLPAQITGRSLPGADFQLPPPLLPSAPTLQGPPPDQPSAPPVSGRCYSHASREPKGRAGSSGRRAGTPRAGGPGGGGPAGEAGTGGAAFCPFLSPRLGG